MTYSLSQAQESELYSERFTDISGYEAVDSGTVAIYLSQPNDRLPCLLNFPIIRDGSSPNGSPQGTGPFVRNGDVLSLDQNWWQGRGTRSVPDRYPMLQHLGGGHPG